MNTPAHLAASLFFWRNETDRWHVVAIGMGAVLPDAPMFAFYGYQKIMGRSEAFIWNTAYFQERWQLCFDLFNSIPIFLGIYLLARFLPLRWLSLLAASALLHCACDLPVHHDDAHRHLLPLTHWRFISPLSYWDPAHYGIWFACVELAFAIFASVYVWRRAESKLMRWLAGANVALYACGLTLAAIALGPRLWSALSG